VVFCFIYVVVLVVEDDYCGKRSALVTTEEIAQPKESDTGGAGKSQIFNPHNEAFLIIDILDLGDRVDFLNFDTIFGETGVRPCLKPEGHGTNSDNQRQNAQNQACRFADGRSRI